MDLCNVTSVSDRTLLALIEYCSLLEEVTVQGCPLVTRELLTRLRLKCRVSTDFDFEAGILGGVKVVPGQI